MIHSARCRVATVANAEQTLLYWRLGKRISTEVLGGDRAMYGGQIVVSVSRQLKTEFGKGFGEKMFGVWFSSPKCSLMTRQLDEKSIRVAEYLMELPPVELLRSRLHLAIELAREQAAQREVSP